MSFRKEIVGLIENFADLLEFTGGNKFKVSAFKNGANILRRLEGDPEEMLRTGELKNVRGIGKGILGVIEEFSTEGKVEEYENLLEQVPRGIMDVMNVRGLGAKKVKVLHEVLGIEDLDDLAGACVEGKVAELKGFGEKTQESIMKEVLRIKRGAGYMLLHHAEAHAKNVLRIVEQCECSERFELTGELRRATEIVSRIEVIISGSRYVELEEELSKLFVIKEVTRDHLSVKLNSEHNGRKVVLHLCKPENYGDVLCATTGAKGFTEKYLKDVCSGNHENEEEIFSEKGVSFVIPEMREEEYFTTSEVLRENSDLTSEALKGMFHFHTTWSDGQNSLEEMIEKARSRGYEYAAVCDHSKSAFYANGLTEERVLDQKKEIEEVSAKLGFPIYHGIESDILRDGSLDYSDDFLGNFDFIVASVHSIFGLPEEEMTARIIGAVENKYANLLGHPTGRLLLSRDPYRVDMKKVIDACAANDVAIEINASPFRLDLDWRLIYYARERGCRFAINPDAHSTEGIDDDRFGIRVARKGGMKRGDVINCFSENEFKKYISKKI